MTYKMVTKIIDKILKPFLLERMSQEQFGFLYNRKILEDIEVSHECRYSSKFKKTSSFILKMDLTKDYDKVD